MVAVMRVSYRNSNPSRHGHAASFARVPLDLFMIRSRVVVFEVTTGSLIIDLSGSKIGSNVSYSSRE